MGSGPISPGAVPPDALLSAYVSSLIRFKARQLSRTPGEREDVAQDLLLAVVAKAHRYDPRRGASFDTFADRVIESAARMILRARRRLKRAGEQTVLSLQGGDPQLGIDTRQRHLRNEPLDPIEAIDTADALRHALDALPPPLAEVARRLREHSASAVARQMGVSRRTIREAMACIRRRFEAAGLDRQ